jgi:hypothetical protein
LELLALIEHLICESERPAGAKLFRSLGPRRLRMAQQQIRREREGLLQVAAHWGLSIEPGGQDRSSNLCVDLAENYSALADAYRRAARIAEQRADLPSMRWLLGRAGMHEEHSRFLRG